MVPMGIHKYIVFIMTHVVHSAQVTQMVHTRGSHHICVAACRIGQNNIVLSSDTILFRRTLYFISLTVYFISNLKRIDLHTYSFAAAIRKIDFFERVICYKNVYFRDLMSGWC